MFNFLKELFFKKRKIKKYSTTLTDVYKGEDNKLNLNPELNLLIEEIKNNNKKINNEDLNKILNFYFPNLKNIEPTLYIFNKDFTNNMVFDINKINFIWNENELYDIILDIKEVTYDMELKIFISIKNFHEVFKKINQKLNIVKEKS